MSENQVSKYRQIMENTRIYPQIHLRLIAMILISAN